MYIIYGERYELSPNPAIKNTTHSLFLNRNMAVRTAVFINEIRSTTLLLGSFEDLKKLAGYANDFKTAICWNCKPAPTCACSSCATFKAHLCRAYHNNKKNKHITAEEALEEFCLRLIFEVLFGFLPFQALHKRLWKKAHQQNGHLLRLNILRAKARATWI